jgi:carboxypeptidase D
VDSRSTQHASDRTHLCKYDINLSYPQPTKFPSLEVVTPNRSDSEARIAEHVLSLAELRTASQKLLSTKSAAKRGLAAEKEPVKCNAKERTEALGLWKHSLTGLPNGTINEWYGCFLRVELTDYALNYTYPWSGCLASSSRVLVLNFHMADETLGGVDVCCL